MGFGRNLPKSKNLLLSEVLEEAVSFKYLGVFIDKHLNFDLHIEHVGKKLAKFNGMLFRARNLFSKTCLLQMYNSYDKPMILCGMLAYGSAKKNKIQLYFCLQKRILKTFSRREETMYSIFSSVTTYCQFLISILTLLDPGSDCQSFSLIFLMLTVTGRTRGHPLCRSSLCQKSKNTQKKSLRNSIIKLFNYLSKESLLPEQISKKKIFLIRTKLT